MELFCRVRNCKKMKFLGAFWLDDSIIEENFKARKETQSCFGRLYCKFFKFAVNYNAKILGNSKRSSSQTSWMHWTAQKIVDRIEDFSTIGREWGASYCQTSWDFNGRGNFLFNIFLRLTKRLRLIFKCVAEFFAVSHVLLHNNRFSSASFHFIAHFPRLTQSIF